MQPTYSQKTVRNQQFNLPKIKSHSQPNLLPDSKSLPLHAHRNSILFKQIRKKQNLQQNTVELSSDSSALIRKIMTPEKKRESSKVQLAVLSLNRNPKQRTKKRMIQQVFVGEEAVQKYYDHYKNLEKNKQKEEFMLQHNPMTRIIQLLEDHSFAPRRLDLIKLKGSHSILDLKQLGLGRGQMGSVVSELVNYLGHFDYIDLTSNNIDITLSDSLISACNRCKIVNLSCNRIGKTGCDKLAQIFLSPKTKIQQLYLTDNHLTDNAGSIFANTLLDYDNLRVLHLNKNYLSQKFARSLKQYLSEDRTLEELYLGWNEFTDKNTKLIFESLANNDTLKVLDYSWNIIGLFSVDTVAETLKSNETLLHVDLSFCDINKKGSELIGKALESNHTIYGLHFEGNSGFVNYKGFVKVTPKQYKDYPLPIIKGVIRNIESIRPNPIRNQYREKSLSDVCWICDSWQQMYIQVKKPSGFMKECFVHLSCEEFRGIKMEAEEDYFMTYRMCPISEIQFFFTSISEDKKKVHYVSEDYPQSCLQRELDFSIGEIDFKHYFPHLNVRTNGFIQDVVDENYFPNVHCQPRTSEVIVTGYQNKKGFIKIKKVIVKKKVMREHKLNMKFRELDFKGGQSFLNDHLDRDQDQEYLMKCLEFDIRHSKITKIIKKPEDLENFKSMMIGYYRDFKDAFYYLANNYPSVSGVYSVSELNFDGFLEEQKYVSKRVTHAKIRIKMYSCLSANEDESSGDRKGAENYKLFCRPQFLEFMIRLGIEKWCTALPKPKKKKDKQTANEELQEDMQKKQKLNLPLPLNEGLEKIMKSLNKFAYRVRASDWRKAKYLVIDNYTVIKAYQPFLLSLFSAYGADKRKMNKPRKIKGLITLEECKRIMIEAGIKRNNEDSKDCDIPFLSSKRLEIEDGLLQFGLNFQQFCEFLARYSQVVWFPPISCEQHELWESEQLRTRIPLFIRFQSLIVNIYRRMPQFHNRRMKMIVNKGIFEQQKQILLERMEQIHTQSKTDLWMKINERDNQDLALPDLIKGLRDRYENATVMKEEQIEEEQERESVD